MNIVERNRKIKRALLKGFKARDISVRGDTGTAYGWVKIKILLDKPKTCTCLFKEQLATWTKKPYIYKYRINPNPTFFNSSLYCKDCLNLLKKKEKKANEIINKSGVEFSYYRADDGYNTERREMILEVEVRN